MRIAAKAEKQIGSVDVQTSPSIPPSSSNGIYRSASRDKGCNFLSI